MTVLADRDVQAMDSMNYLKQINKINLSNRISITKIKYWTPTNWELLNSTEAFYEES